MHRNINCRDLNTKGYINSEIITNINLGMYDPQGNQPNTNGNDDIKSAIIAIYIYEPCFIFL